MIYYAHSMKTYGKQKEKEELEWLNDTFRDVLNPNGDLDNRKEIGYYLNVVTKCSMVVVSEYEGYIGRGVYREVSHALELNKDVWVMRIGYAGVYVLISVVGVEIVDDEDWAIRYGKVVLDPEGRSL